MILLLLFLSLTATLDESGVTHSVITAEFNDSAGDEYLLNVSGSIDGLTVTDRSGLVINHSIIQHDDYSIVNATIPYDFLRFEFTSSSHTVKNQSLWIFLMSLSGSKETDLDATLHFPRGTVLKSTNGAAEADGNLLVRWSGFMDPEHKATMRASYELRPVEEDYLFPILGIFIFIPIILYLFKPRKEEKGLEMLDGPEKEIVLEIRRKGGQTTQAHLQKSTNMPKVTLSRKISSLERRGVIKKSQKGTTNLITLE